MTIFIASVATVIVVSCFCSLSEASIYAVRRPYVRSLTDEGYLAGRVLEGFKKNMERPISAILIVNTAANTAGAAIAGAQARALFGPESLVWFSVLFTLAVLFFSEIIPKILGVVYNRGVARAVALPWQAAIVGLTPVVWTVEKVSHWLKPNAPILAAPEEEVLQLARLSAEEGSILDMEARLVRNVLRLDQLTAEDVMTPRPVVFKLPEDLTLDEVSARVKTWHFSRIPIYESDNPESWTGFVRTQEILSALAQDQHEVTLKELARPIEFVTLGTPGHELLTQLIQRQAHIFGVVDPFGGVAGVVTLEDVLESVIGAEIVDEVDPAHDLQEFARQRHRRRMQQLETEVGEQAGNGPGEPSGSDADG